MGKCKYVIATLVVALAALIVYQKNANDVQPEVMAEDVWWGPKFDPAVDGNSDVRPFQINITNEVISDLKNRLSKVKRMVKPLQNVNFEYGFNSDYLSKFIDHWSNNYDWTTRQAYLNKLPQFKTRIYGLDVHFIHVIPPKTNLRKIPLLMLHGWPGSIVEFYKIIPMMTTPREGYDFVFEVIVPSLPGYGFSDAPIKSGMGPAHMGQIFVKLMERLSHEQFYIQGGDWGAAITETISKIFPEKVYGMHSNMCSTLSSLTLCDMTRLFLGIFWPSLAVSSDVEEKNTYPLSSIFSNFLEETGYIHLQMTKPDTVGVALTDSPTGLAAYILEKFSTWSNINNKHLPDGGLSKFNTDELLDNVMIYWVTGSITTSMRLYSEFGSKNYQALPHLKAKVKVPSACILFPHDLPLMLVLKKLLKHKYINLVRASEASRGGHFAAFEEPALLAKDVWLTIFEMEKIRNSI